MAKIKKAMKAKKAKKVMRAKVKKIKKVVTAKKTKIKAAAKVKVVKEKVLGKIDHYFDNISVAAIKVSAPFKVGAIIHIKGHTTDFAQRVDSMQIEHQSVEKVKKGDDVGIKVKDYVRQHDLVYLSDEKGLAVKPVKPLVVQQPMFPEVKPAAPKLPTPAIKPQPAEQAKPISYSEKKFLSF